MDELEALLREALATELRNRRGAGSVNRLKEIERACHSLYTNPDNWRLGRLVELRCSDTGEIVGVFREQLHKRVSARRLQRTEGEPGIQLAPDIIEYVTGPQWQGLPFHHLVDPPSEEDIRTVRKFFKPHSWQPAWKHKQKHRVANRVANRSADELLKEFEFDAQAS